MVNLFSNWIFLGSCDQLKPVKCVYDQNLLSYSGEYSLVSWSAWFLRVKKSKKNNKNKQKQELQVSFGYEIFRFLRFSKGFSDSLVNLF